MRALTRIGLGLLILMVPAVASNYLRHQEAQKAARLRLLFQLPPEAVIVSGNETGWFLIDAEIEFRLPHNRSPEQWLQLLDKQNTSTVLTRQRKNPLLYECLEDCNHGITKLEYIRARDIYKSSYYED